MNRQSESSELQRIYGCQRDERLKGKAEGSIRLAYTGLRRGLEHLKIRIYAGCSPVRATGGVFRKKGS
jgi:hypothetical protein